MPAERIDQHLPKENLVFGLGAGHGGSSWVEVVFYVCFIILRKYIGLHGHPPWSTVRGEPPGPPGRLRPTDEEMERRERVLHRC